MTPKMGSTDCTALLPFATSEETRGLGLGFSAFVRVLAESAGSHTSLAQVFRETADGKLEAQELELDTVGLSSLTSRGEVPPMVTHVLTGRIEAPGADPGYLRLSVLDVQSGRRSITVESPFDNEDAGPTFARSLGELSAGTSLRFPDTAPIAALSWASLGELLRAERCLLFNPREGRPSDVNAALLHFERAIAEAGDTPGLPARRLASMVREAALESPTQRWLDAAARSVGRARVDAPDDPDLLESAAQLGLARGIPGDAREALKQASPGNERVWTTVLRVRLEAITQGPASALQMLDAGLAHAPTDPLMLSERGRLLAATGRVAEAAAVLDRVLGAFPCFPYAYAALAAIAKDADDAATASRLLDMVFTMQVRAPQVMRAAFDLMAVFEPPGIARASRRLTLLEAMRHGPHDPIQWRIQAAEAHTESGDTKRALRLLEEARAKCTTAAEHQDIVHARLQIATPTLLLAADANMRAAKTLEVSDLRALIERAERLGRETEYAPFFIAAGIAAERLGDHARARALKERVTHLHLRTSST